MRHLGSLLLAVIICAGAYYVTFERSANAPLATSARAAVPPGGGPSRGQGGQATAVTLSTVEVTPYLERFRAIGTLNADASVTVVSEVTGRITEIAFTANIPVEKGAVLVRLDDAAQRIALKSAEASLRQARATLDRYASLTRTNSGAVAGATLEEAQLAVELAEADLDMAQYDLEQRIIRAPIAGTPGLTELQEGAYLSTGTDLVRLVDSRILTVAFSLPDRAVPSLSQGVPVRMTSPALPGAVFTGEVTSFDNRIDPQTRLIAVKARFGNAERQLMPGSVVSVEIASETVALPVVPAGAITWTRGGAQVWLAEDGKARAVPVTVRAREGDRVWLGVDLPDGAQVVAEGVQKMREGTAIHALEEDPAPGTVTEVDTTRPERG